MSSCLIVNEADKLAIALLLFYEKSLASRSLWWRVDGHVDAQCIVEGLLLRTRHEEASAKSEPMMNMTAAEWLDAPESFKQELVDGLGLPVIKVRTANRIASVVARRRWQELMSTRHADSMVMRRVGLCSWHLDAVMTRVATRLAGSGLHMRSLIEQAMLFVPYSDNPALSDLRPSGYRLVTALLDIGSMFCKPKPLCAGCPVRTRCKSGQRGPNAGDVSS